MTPASPTTTVRVVVVRGVIAPIKAARMDAEESRADAVTEGALELPASMLRQVDFSDDDDETELRVVKMVPVDESEDTW